MNALPDRGMLLSYWMYDVGIGPPNDRKHVQVPLTDILKYRLPDGRPQTNIVFLFAGFFVSGTGSPYFTFEDSILRQLTLQPGQTRTNVQQLQDAGIKVLLSVYGRDGIGWDRVRNISDFAYWTKREVLDKYGLDGIDIDNEYGGERDVRNFMNTIGELRQQLSGYLITMPLWKDHDDDYFVTPVGRAFPMPESISRSSMAADDHRGVSRTAETPF